MKLELLHEAAKSSAKPIKLLFIHGICTGAWVWESNFLPFFAGLGYESYALSLRGHGKSEGRKKVREFTLSDFADDVGWALKKIGDPVVIIGHSLGGGVVQSFIQGGGKAAGVVLLCSAPPHGLIRASASMYTSNPKLAHEMGMALHHGLRAANIDIIENSLFSEPPSSEVRQRFAEGSADVAEAASRQLMGWIPFAPFPWGMPKLLVVGGEKDQFMPPTDVRLTAIYYAARSFIVPNGAHAIMLDKSWRDAAQPIADWLAKTFKG